LEPTVGFEVRLFDRMGLADDPAPVPITRGQRSRGPRRWAAGTPRWALASAAAVVALFAGLSIGWSMGSPSPQPNRAETAVATADLMEQGTAVGTVATYGGATPWMIVTMHDSSAHGALTCEVVTDNGVTHKIGTFSATYGYAAWDAPLKVTAQDVRKAEVVSSNGTVIASASLS
jgi:hypothetical protein